MLRTIEQKIESLFEGAFGRAFRRNVQPVELARKLAKEMDDYKMVSVSQVYVPNEYVVYLSPSDHAQFESYEPALIRELEEMDDRVVANWESQARCELAERSARLDVDALFDALDLVTDAASAR